MSWVTAADVAAAPMLSVDRYPNTVEVGEVFSVDIVLADASPITLPQCAELHQLDDTHGPCVAVAWKFLRAGIRPQPVRTVSNLAGWETALNIRARPASPPRRVQHSRVRIRAPGRPGQWSFAITAATIRYPSATGEPVMLSILVTPPSATVQRRYLIVRTLVVLYLGVLVWAGWVSIASAFRRGRSG